MRSEQLSGNTCAPRRTRKHGGRRPARKLHKQHRRSKQTKGVKPSPHLQSKARCGLQPTARQHPHASAKTAARTHAATLRRRGCASPTRTHWQTRKIVAEGVQKISAQTLLHNAAENQKRHAAQLARHEAQNVHGAIPHCRRIPRNVAAQKACSQGTVARTEISPLRKQAVQCAVGTGPDLRAAGCQRCRRSGMPWAGCVSNRSLRSASACCAQRERRRSAATRRTPCGARHALADWCLEPAP